MKEKQGQGGGASYLQRILSLSKVRRLTLTGERVPASELYWLGAVEACLHVGGRWGRRQASRYHG
jgi:enoyl-CoA hydratase/carnithine racemase